MTLKVLPEPGLCYNRHILPAHPQEWPFYEKFLLVQAVKMDGPFSVETPTGVVECSDGYLALDVDGNPYPIPTSIFERIYSEVS